MRARLKKEFAERIKLHKNKIIDLHLKIINSPNKYHNVVTGTKQISKELHLGKKLIDTVIKQCHEQT